MSIPGRDEPISEWTEEDVAYAFDRCCIAASKVEVHKADVTFTYCKESEEVQGIVTAVFKELGLLPK